MERRTLVGVALVVVGAGVALAFAFGPGLLSAVYGTDGYHPATPTENATGTPTSGAYDHVTVAVVAANGTELGTVRAAVADTSKKRYTGLSKTESLPPDAGMLFVHDEAGRHTYVMREMDFGIDIVFADANGTITRIHHAPAPGPGEDGESQRYPGRGKYVLEVNYEWTTRHGVSEGDRIVVREG